MPDDERANGHRRMASMGGLMKKAVLLAAVAAFAAAPAAAGAKQLTRKEAMAQNQKSWELVKQGLPLVLPSWALPLYFGMHMDEKLKPASMKRK
jgi:hypothetical protein